ncbi:hypothetical protein DAPPUDRAFT_262942 [Daphnia pulex]|uniref:Uncharacterized protein n=1 Tax=Daphnia pulex TaxID=6669 RepID=E9HNZ1_DAPPU|nr:hypothetical protein DAPPUDRAFT_262942 [Daphnia pulex]|eukprot:EFX66549.1 hypothetical protein DAPPUDRAFT_262942 [Daphnia pulex]
MSQRLSFKLSCNVDRRWPAFNTEAALMSGDERSESDRASECSSMVCGYLEPSNPSVQCRTLMLFAWLMVVHFVAPARVKHSPCSGCRSHPFVQRIKHSPCSGCRYHPSKVSVASAPHSTDPPGGSSHHSGTSDRTSPSKSYYRAESSWSTIQNYTTYAFPAAGDSSGSSGYLARIYSFRSPILEGFA